MLGSLHQQRAEGELILEQYDGTRKLYFMDGDLRYLRSDAAGEQFGNYLLRLGILDYPALQEVLADKHARLGDRVVQWGLLSEQERDGRLHELFAAIMLHALEHPVLNTSWVPQTLDKSLGADLQFPLDHRFLIWKVFEEMSSLEQMAEQLQSEGRWRWRAGNGLLESMSDLPLTPQLAYALTLLSPEPVSYETILSMTGLDEAECARLVLVCWTLGGLELAEGPSPLQTVLPPEPEPVPQGPPPPTIEFETPEPELKVPPAEPAPAPEVVAQAMPEEGPGPPKTPVPEGPTAQQRARAYFKQAESLELQGRPSEAIRMLEEAIRMDGDSPRSYDSWLLLGRLRMANPAWSTRVIEALQAAARVRPHEAEPWVLMGELYHRKEFPSNARACFRKALEIDPSVMIPVDFSMDDETDPGVHAKEGHGLLDRIKGLIKGD